jgi:hypothetical protein
VRCLLHNLPSISSSSTWYSSSPITISSARTARSCMRRVFSEFSMSIGTLRRVSAILLCHCNLVSARDHIRLSRDSSNGSISGKKMNNLVRHRKAMDPTVFILVKCFVVLSIDAKVRLSYFERLINKLHTRRVRKSEHRLWIMYPVHMCINRVLLTSEVVRNDPLYVRQSGMAEVSFETLPVLDCPDRYSRLILARRVHVNQCCLRR